LKKEYTDWDLIQSKKDTTRPSNVYYGLNWGYRSDETMEKSIDTGDLLFYNYDCSKCFTPGDVLKCHLQQKWKNLTVEHSQNVAFTQRISAHKLLVITSHFGGEP